jgi:hypothetical protein
MKKNAVFVFGSNLSGIHGAGAARHANMGLKFPWGKGEGFSAYGLGNTAEAAYALPTKGLKISFMTLEQVRPHVAKFIEFATAHPDMDFQVTQVGCGLGGFTKEAIAPLFEDAPSNCYFDTAWEDLLPDAQFWGTF